MASFAATAAPRREWVPSEATARRHYVLLRSLEDRLTATEPKATVA